MTVHRFLTAFKAAFGASPVQYILDQRLRKVRWLLAHTTLPLGEIALATGFCNQSYMTEQFKAHYDQTPRQFRQSMKSP